ncbi:TPR-like protein [Ramicandelaber brevisporus]|nr:TPR-like protein [Ramicandelaber brevisporus]
MYISSPTHPDLIPMLRTLLGLHQASHLPTALLLACVHFSRGDLHLSLTYNLHILSLDPDYVESMSNIGTTLRKMGYLREAERWWWRAVRLRPGYWDAVENLLSLLCHPPSISTSMSTTTSVSQVLSAAAAAAEALSRNVQNLTLGVSHSQLPRLQNLFYQKGTILNALGQQQKAAREYEKAVETMLDGRTLLGTLRAAADFGKQNGAFTFQRSQESEANLPVEGYVNGIPISLPLVLFMPEHVTKLIRGLFPEGGGVLPGMPANNNNNNAPGPAPGSPLQSCMHLTSTILLTLSKLYTDHGLVQNTQAVTFLLYYLCLAIVPSPSTCNNLGIMLCGIATPMTQTQIPISASVGAALAMRFYYYGLTLNNKHPHLYTNLGSLLKDLGFIDEAIRMYKQAIDSDPNFDVALANLGNALKDQGKVSESVEWYLRATKANPNFVEAICGLANTLATICEWRGRNSATMPANQQTRPVLMAIPSGRTVDVSCGWMDRIVEITHNQFRDHQSWAAGLLLPSVTSTQNAARNLRQQISGASNITTTTTGELVSRALSEHFTRLAERTLLAVDSWLRKLIISEGGWAIRTIERLGSVVQWRMFQYAASHYQHQHQHQQQQPPLVWTRPTLPAKLAQPPLPTVLPFHTFTYPLDGRIVRMISYKNAIRVSHSVLSAPWLPRSVYPPPPPPFTPQCPRLVIGYVSSDFTNHPLAHLTQSVYGMHDRTRFHVIGYATTKNDGSAFRAKIERESETFRDVSSWSFQQIVEQIVRDGVHILVNLNGYTKGAKNEIFAARPAPILASYLGYAGSMGAQWCDWFIVDPIVCPPDTVGYERRKQLLSDRGLSVYDGEDASMDDGELNPEDSSTEWMYTERIVYMPHTYFVSDHRQGFREASDVNVLHSTAPLASPTSLHDLAWANEQAKRLAMRRELFPTYSDDTFIFANFNQLYKIDPICLRTWLRILSRVPHAILWLLRFPPAGEAHIKRTAEEWAGPDVARRVVFTDIAPKHQHVARGRIADLFLDTFECNAHTTAMDIMWTATPILTWPRHRHKFCSRVAASIVSATGFGRALVARSAREYEDKAVKLAMSVYNPPSSMTVLEIRRHLFLTRDRSRLYDTPRWVYNVEKAYVEMWNRFADGRMFTMSSGAAPPPSSPEEDAMAAAQDSWDVPDDDDIHVSRAQGDSVSKRLRYKKMTDAERANSSCIWIADDEDGYNTVWQDLDL